jgi:glutaconate CoA-transferase subunit A
MAHAARTTLVSVEAFSEQDLLTDDHLAAGTIPALYVSALTQVPNGAWPVGLFGRYGPDHAHLQRYVEMAGTASGFEQYVRQYVHKQRVSA